MQLVTEAALGLVILKMKEKKQPLKYSKGIIFLLTGIIAIVASRLLGENSEAYGFLIGYGYTAILGGIAGLFIAYFRNYKSGKHMDNYS